MRRRVGTVVAKAIKGMVNQTTRVIKEKNYSASDMGVLAASAGCMVSVFGFIIALILFIVSGGYTVQISAIKDNGWDKGFTAGNVAMLYNSIGTIAAISIIAGVVFLAVAFLKKASPAKRFLMTTNLVFMVCFSGLTVIYSIIISGKIDFTEKQLNTLRKFFSIVNYETILKILFGLVFFTIIIFVVLILLSELRWLLFHLFKSAVISFVGIPFILLLTENLIALAATAVFCVIVVLVLFMIGSMLKEAGGADGANSMSLKATPTSTKHKEETKPKIKTINVASGYRLYLDKGTGLGAQTTYIFTDTAVQNRVCLCTYEEFEKGKVIIKKGGTPITRIY